jgi:uncharacterized LabA/DUF88 family protein
VVQISRAPKDFTDYRQMMVFIDGENITMRFQDMIAKGKKPRTSVFYEKDIYVWDPAITKIVGKHEIIRATYYTYVVGDDDRLKQISNVIKTLTYYKNGNSQLPNFLYPYIFRKSKSARNGKGVDIQMTVDILNNVHSNYVDTILLVSGDGDYLPIIKEAIRCGKQVYVAAFSSGLNPVLKDCSDLFLDLDDVCFIE